MILELLEGLKTWMMIVMHVNGLAHYFYALMIKKLGLEPTFCIRKNTSLGKYPIFHGEAEHIEGPYYFTWDCVEKTFVFDKKIHPSIIKS